MEDEKRRIIVTEIKHWRQHKLLPEHYCDFLLNLYRNNETDEKQENKGTLLGSLKNSNWQAWLAGAAALGLMAFIILNFARLAMPVQIGVSLLFIVCCYGIGLLRRDRSPLYAFGLSGIGSLALLLSGMYILRESGLGEPGYVVAYIAVTGFIWLAAGIAGRMGVLHFCGWVALLFVYGWLLQKAAGELNWGWLELSWIPLSFLFIWIAWLLHHRNKSITAVILIVGVIIWFMPEVHGLIASGSEETPILQFSLVGKLIIGAIALYTSRKKWIEWVV